LHIRKVNWHHIVPTWYIPYLFIVWDLLCRPSIDGGSISTSFIFVASCLYYSRNHTKYHIYYWMVGAMDHTIQCWILVEFKEFYFFDFLLTF
jgi:hypothetical protein